MNEAMIEAVRGIEGAKVLPTGGVFFSATEHKDLLAIRTRVLEALAPLGLENFRWRKNEGKTVWGIYGHAGHRLACASIVEINARKAA